MRIKVTGIPDDLQRDLERIPVTAARKFGAVVQRNVNYGARVEQRIARSKAGPHGRDYYKRISAEMTGPMTGEWGPTGEVVGNAVGAGWRHGINNDSAQSLDIQGPKFRKDVEKVIDSLFWPGA